MSISIPIHIYSDGSYFEKKSTGGWGAVLFEATPTLHELSRISGTKHHTCSLEMELTAAYNGLKLLEKVLKNSSEKNDQITIFTDSRVLLEGLEQKIQHWRQKKWIHKSGNPVKYQSLWESLDSLTQKYQVNWCWVKGHNGNLGNTLADQLAREATTASR